MVVPSATCGLMGCSYDLPSYEYGADELNMLADSLAVSLVGYDAFTWNVCSIRPEQSYGVTIENPQWYTYEKVTQNDIYSGRMLLNLYKRELNKVDYSALGAADAATYRAIDYALNTYNDYYSSQYAAQFSLMGGSFINATGGYVSDFADTCENYAFRNENDVKNLLSLTVSTKDAFVSYLNFADDRAQSGYPLYDYTINAMQDYLDKVAKQGTDYYLYSLTESMIDGATFLSETEKDRYKTEYSAALTDCFMVGVRELSQGLESYKGNVETTEESYLTAYGNAGRAYYEWMFKQKTGMRNVNMYTVYNDIYQAYVVYNAGLQTAKAQAEQLETTNKAAFDDYKAYKNGDKALLGLDEPQEMMDYLKVAAKKIVPDLKSMPEITFKYMDDTAAEISNALAYYLHSPIDEQNATERITINGYTTAGNPAETLTVLAHEGYPGHLYAYVNAKENGTSLLATLVNCSAFSEGWANYTELALLNNIAEETDDVAVKLYCNESYYATLTGYVASLLNDMMVNYFGYSVEDMVKLGEDRENAQTIVERLMEIPAAYVPYGYGMHVMVELHNSAKAALGERYDECEFNRALLSEGFAPTLDRAKSITSSFVSKKKSAA